MRQVSRERQKSDAIVLRAASKLQKRGIFIDFGIKRDAVPPTRVYFNEAVSTLKGYFTLSYTFLEYFIISDVCFVEFSIVYP